MRMTKKLLPLLLTVLVLLSSGCAGGGRAGAIPGDECLYRSNTQVYPYCPGWYRGVLHNHALYNSGETPIGKVVSIAENQGFDFMVLTNHNTVFQWCDPAYSSSELTLLYGVEWTSMHGHGNIWSSQPFDWHAIEPTLKTGDAEKAIGIAHALAAEDHPVLFSINHPRRSGSWQNAYEKGWGVDSIEIWNRNDFILHTSVVPGLFIRHGMKPAWVGGSDDHLEWEGKIRRYTNELGSPTTWVFARSRSGKDILEGIRQRHIFISASVEGPRMAFSASTPKGPIMMGDTLPVDTRGRPVDFQVSVSHAQTPYGVVIVKNGQVREEWSRKFPGVGSSFAFTDTPGDGDYYWVEVRQIPSPSASFEEILKGTVTAVTNPIYTW